MPTELSKLADEKPVPVRIVNSNGDDPWAILYENLRKTNENQCEAWKDEVANLLILAGLFSAVVTAFVIETYRTLSPNPNDAIINLLSIIATNSNSSISPTSGSLIQTQFSPTATSVRVNIFFFLSLVLGLGTALIGIVCLQWLRQHRSYPEHLSPEQRVALLNMRITALQRWKVHVILASLPLILQAALVIFFIGLAEFVWHIDHRVIIPVGAFIAAILLFLILTTILPTLQLFFLHHSKRFIYQDIPVECPYKSPQAAAFRILITSSKVVFVVSSCLFLPLYYILAPFYHIPIHLCLTPVYLYRSAQNVNNRWNEFWFYKYRGPTLRNFCRSEVARYQQQWVLAVDTLKKEVKQVVLSQALNIPNFGIDKFCGAGAKDNWDSFDEKWIEIRDTFFRYRCSSQSWLYQTRRDRQASKLTWHYYDAMHGLRRLVVELNFSIEDDFLRTATFRCIQAPPWVPHSGSKQLNQLDDISIFKTRNQYLSSIMQPDTDTDQLTTSLSDILSEKEKLTEEMLMDESTCIFLMFVKSSLTKNAQTGGEASRELSKNFAESQLRLLNSLYGRHFVLKPNALKGELDIPLVIQPRALYATPEVDQTDEPFTYQWAVAVHSFFKLLTKESNPITESNHNTDSDPSTRSESHPSTDSGSEPSMSEFDPDINTFVAHPISQSLLSDFCKEIWIWCNRKSKPGKFYESTIKECTEGLEFIKQSVNVILESKKPRSHRLFLYASYYVYLISKRNPESSELLDAAENVYAQLKLYKEHVWQGVVEITRTGAGYGLIENTAWNLYATDSWYQLFSEDWWEDWSRLAFSSEINTPGLNFLVPKNPKDTAKQNTGNEEVDKDQTNAKTAADPTQNEVNQSNPASPASTRVINMADNANNEHMGMNPDAHDLA